MSLVGSLEDLGLGDILQIVSLSRKSGVLNLTWESRKGKILFRDGQVVSAISNDVPVRIENLLAQPDSGIGPEAIAEAVSLKRGIGKGKTLRDILIERLGIVPELVENKVREHIEKIVFGFFSWTEGNFNFDLKDGSFEEEELGSDGAGTILSLGLNPQFLAMEGTRLQDEMRRTQAAAEIAPPPPPAAQPSAPAHEEEHPGFSDAFTETHHDEASPPQAGPEASAPAQPQAAPTRAKQEQALVEEAQIPQVLVVDDDPEILNLVHDRLRGIGLKGEGLLRVNEALRRLDELLAAGTCPVIIADLFMPRTDGEGILGGLELVETVKARAPYVPIILISDYPNDAAQKEAKAAGLDHYLDKPKRSQIWGDKPTPELIKFTEGLREILPEMVTNAVLPRDDRHAADKPALSVPHVVSAGEGLIDLGTEIRAELGEVGGAVGLEEGPPSSRGLNLLKTMINELNDPSFAGQITLMVLRFASEMMNRAIIFLVARDQVAGLGQFGVDLNGIDPWKQVRRMRIPISEPSIFREVIQKRSVYKKPLPDTEWNNYLVKHLGGVRPVESFGAPIMASGKIAAILYGDNVPELKPIGDTDSLEIFLAQAGLAMERAFLERRISELSIRQR